MPRTRCWQGLNLEEKLLEGSYWKPYLNCLLDQFVIGNVGNEMIFKKYMIPAWTPNNQYILRLRNLHG